MYKKKLISSETISTSLLKCKKKDANMPKPLYNRKQKRREIKLLKNEHNFVVFI